MARRYDSRTTVFSPEGRLFQIEYALESIGNAGVVIGILAEGKDPEPEPEPEVKKGDAMDVETEESVRERIRWEEKKKVEAERKAKFPGPARPGIVFVTEKKMVSKLLETDSGNSEKIYSLNDDVMVAAAGITADANGLVELARINAQAHLSQFNENISMEEVVRTVCDVKQMYTQRGGLRPYGVSFLFGGYDPYHGFQLYNTDPSGNYSGWKASCIGNNSATATSILRKEWRPDLGIDEALSIGLKVLAKTMDSVEMSADRVEIGALTRDDSGKTVKTIFTPKQVNDLLVLEGHKKPEDD